MCAGSAVACLLLGVILGAEARPCVCSCACPLLACRILLRETGMFPLHTQQQGPEPLLLGTGLHDERANGVEQMRGGVSIIKQPL
jgi:hypothetical protein